jgi:predicted enzyme related to lactoylglutathione lyase
MAVAGIGGVFFRANDPATLQAWYRQHLGIGGEDPFHWTQTAGPALFMPFKQDTDYFPAAKQWMINFRVTALAEMIATLRSEGIEVTTHADWDTPQTGKFAHITDPEGNMVELWEPPQH